jgi:hypothetical protein
VLVLTLVIGIATLLYGLWLIPSNVRWGGAVTLVSGAVLICIGLLFLCGADLRLNISLALLATGAALFAANAILELYEAGSVNERLKAARDAGREYDVRHPLDVLAELRRNGSEAYAFIPPRTVLARRPGASLVPLGGIASVSTVFCSADGRYVIYESDRYGFNNDDGVYARGGQRMLVAGDSFGHGFCVPAGEDLAARLRAVGYSAISISASGNGPLLELAALREYVPLLRPRVVLWLYYDGNDLSDLAMEYAVPMLRRYLQEPAFSQGLAHRQPEVDQFLKSLAGSAEEQGKPKRGVGTVAFRGVLMKAKNLLTLARLRHRLGLSASALRSRPEDRNPALRELDAAALLKVVFEAARNEVTKNGGELHVAYLPSISNFREGSPRGSKCGFAREDVWSCKAAVLAAAAELGIPVVNFETVLRRSGRPQSFYSLGSHYTPEGYELLARTVISHIVNLDRLAQPESASAERATVSQVPHHSTVRAPLIPPTLQPLGGGESSASRNGRLPGGSRSAVTIFARWPSRSRKRPGGRCEPMCTGRWGLV